MNADESESGTPLAFAIDGARILERDAELVDSQARRDIRMAARIDIGVHAQGDPGLAASCGRQRGNAIEFARRLGVDDADTGANRVFELLARLADAREDHLPCGAA